ncbi:MULTISPECIES: STAS domain-containing protein [unclassified Streptomyces]|uniref:STAS domain-containing protein n=1 Tax=unclassified Streptomyces TaxID=2593676 RepID=UPI00136A37ED|nr:STAS domain-containing protein [Streptomyces sp. YIM 132580]MXG25730.1 STAS domain-containing protein [Streptomyces sp. YIM 132580]NYS20073.1 STAS domain-containing protein [Streptomyces sp. SJ1-7]
MYGEQDIFQLIEPAEGTLVLAVVGEVDVDDTEAAHEVAGRFCAGDQRLSVVDLSRTTFLSSDFLNVLLRLYHHHREHGRRLVLVPPRGAALTPLQVTGLDAVFTTAPDLDSALGS